MTTTAEDQEMAAFVAWAVKKYGQHAYRHTSATSGEWAAWQAAATEVATLRSQLEHWKTFAIHAEGEHAAWKKTATELDEELRALKAAAADGRTYTQADLMEAVKTERHACSIAVWMTLQDALADDADDKGLDGWMREAEARVKRRP